MTLQSSIFVFNFQSLNIQFVEKLSDILGDLHKEQKIVEDREQLRLQEYSGGELTRQLNAAVVKKSNLRVAFTEFIGLWKQQQVPKACHCRRSCQIQD